MLIKNWYQQKKLVKCLMYNQLITIHRVHLIIHNIKRNQIWVQNVFHQINQLNPIIRRNNHIKYNHQKLNVYKML